MEVALGAIRTDMIYWEYDKSLRAFLGYADHGEANGVDIPEVLHRIPAREVAGLMECATNEGIWMSKPMGRVEDLKIIHRLLDVLEK